MKRYFHVLGRTGETQAPIRMGAPAVRAPRQAAHDDARSQQDLESLRAEGAKIPLARAGEREPSVGRILGKRRPIGTPPTQLVKPAEFM